MGVLKNDVGRPSNKTITIRRILNGILILIGLGLVAYIGYYIGNKNDKTANVKPLNDSKEAKTTTTTTTTSKVKEKAFDKNMITIKTDENDYNTLYVYGKKVFTSVIPGTIGLGKIETIDDIAVIEYDNIYLIIVNTDGDILYNSAIEIDDKGEYCINVTSECKEFEIDDNKIYYYLENLGQDVSTVCKRYNKEVLAKYEISYENGVLLSPKKLSSITDSEYVKKHNINCDN